jgi:hypothetical protein
MISCDILASTTGKLRPYFAQECPNAFRTCLTGPSSSSSSSAATGSAQAAALMAGEQRPPLSRPISDGTGGGSSDFNGARPGSAPIQSNPAEAITNPLSEALIRNRRQAALGATVDRRLLERQWIMLEGVNLVELCQFSGDSIQAHKFGSLARSWPSFPASIVTYAVLYVAAYLCFIGTARPFRVITSVLVVVILLVAAIFDVQLVREHYAHWEDTLSGAVLALLVVVLVLFVYLNKFRDSHYYENQKLPKRNLNHNMSNGYSNEIALEQYNLDKADDEPGSVSNLNTSNNNNNNIHNTDGGGSVPNNDLAMRYFQIPRANYRGAPRPLQ